MEKIIQFCKSGIRVYQIRRSLKRGVAQLWALWNLLTELVATFGSDFNEDGFVDELDFAAWESNFGSTTATHMTGDANADAAADGFDFLKWQYQFGMPEVEFVSASTAIVPEPSSMLLAGFAGMILCGMRRG